MCSFFHEVQQVDGRFLPSNLIDLHTQIELCLFNSPWKCEEQSNGITETTHLLFSGYPGNFPQFFRRKPQFLE